MANKSDAVKSLKEATSLKSIKEKADTLDLGLDKLDVSLEESESEPETTIRRASNSSTIISRLVLNNNVKLQAPEEEPTSSTNIISSSISAVTSNSLSQEEQELVNLSVNPTLASSIQSKIIGARQQMTSMMSDIARAMYENYKPPVTAFRINLTPAALGSIAILMRNSREELYIN